MSGNALLTAQGAAHESPTAAHTGNKQDHYGSGFTASWLAGVSESGTPQCLKPIVNVVA